jgi:hypothetical protein
MTDTVVEMIFYPDCTILVYADGSDEVNEMDKIKYVQEDVN